MLPTLTLNIIQTAPCHTIGTSEVDDLCFQKDKNINYILSRIGVIRLLSTLHRSIEEFHLCKDWDNVKQQINTILSNKTNNTVHMTQLEENTNLPTTTPSTQFQNLPKEKATSAHHSKSSSQTQDAHFHVHTKTYPTQRLTLEPPNKSTYHTPNTWYKPQTDFPSLLAAPHSIPVNRQTYQSYNIRGVTGMNKTPHHIRDNRYI